jgi:hypothetical protein
MPAQAWCCWDLVCPDQGWEVDAEPLHCSVYGQCHRPGESPVSLRTVVLPALASTAVNSTAEDGFSPDHRGSAGDGSRAPFRSRLHAGLTAGVQNRCKEEWSTVQGIVRSSRRHLGNESAEPCKPLNCTGGGSSAATVSCGGAGRRALHGAGRHQGSRPCP